MKINSVYNENKNEKDGQATYSKMLSGSQSLGNDSQLGPMKMVIWRRRAQGGTSAWGLLYGGQHSLERGSLLLSLDR